MLSIGVPPLMVKKKGKDGAEKIRFKVQREEVSSTLQKKGGALPRGEREKTRH